MKISLRWAFTGIALFASTAILAAQTATLTILHTNDTHGHLTPFSYPGILPDGAAEAQLRVRKDIGGIARRATLAKSIRTELKGKPVWLVDAGDFCDGSPFTTEYHGDADTEAMNAAGYDFGTFGNHEYNNPLTQTLKLVAEAKRKLVCANAVLKSTGKNLMPSYVVQNVEGVKVGIFGLVTEEAAGYSAAQEGVAILPEVETAKKIVAVLRPKVDVIVMLSHIGEENDVKIAAKVKGIDVIVGGHSHTRLPVGEFVPWTDALLPDRINGTIVVQDHQWGGELGRLDLLFEKSSGKWHVARYRERLLPITSQIQADPDVEAVIQKFWQPIAAKYTQPIGTAAADFSMRGDDMADYNLVADAIRETFGVDFEMENLGGVRSPLVKGPILQSDLYTMLPFNNTIYTVSMKGREIKAVLLKEKPAVSGIRYRIEFGQLTEATIGGVPIDDDRVYAGAANSFFASFALKDYKPADSGRSWRQTVIDYIILKATLSPRYDSRRVVVE